jgi:AraC-like DNA-binding protein
VTRQATTIVGIAGPLIKRRLVGLLPQIAMCDTWDDVVRTIENADRAVLFVDPRAFDDAVDAVVKLHERFAIVAIVVCAVLDGESIQLVTRLARAGFGELVVFGYDDSPQRLKLLVEDATPAPTLSLSLLSPALQQLPPPMQRALIMMFEEPRRFRTTEDLAVAAGLSLRATFRHLRKAGFASPRLLVASARVLRAHQLLVRSDRSATAVANRLGYRTVDQLSQHCFELAGCTATDMKKGLGPSDVATVVLARLLAPKKAPIATVSAADGEYAFTN